LARRRLAVTAHRLILDSGAVFALAKLDVRARAALASAWEHGWDVVVPAVVVAETVRGNGPRDAPVNRVLKAVGTVAATSEDRARTAGELLGRAKVNATVDALVVAEAVRRGGGVIMTSDAEDLRRLIGDHTGVVIKPI
jgi:predicted nucleic acid-binding protein